MYTPTIAGTGGLHGLGWSSQHQPYPQGAPVVPLLGGGNGGQPTSGVKEAVRVVPGGQGPNQNHSPQFVHHQPVVAPPAPPHTIPHRHHSGLPARRSSNARRSLSRALSSRPQLQRSIRRKDAQILHQLHSPSPQADQTSAAASRPQSVASALLKNPDDFTSSLHQKTQEQTLPVTCSTVVITCPGDELQQRRDSLWEYQNRHRGGGGAGTGSGPTPASRTFKPETPNGNNNKTSTQASGNNYKPPRAWTVAGLYLPNDLKRGIISLSSSISSGSGSLQLSSPDRLSASSPPAPGGGSGTGNKMPYRLRPLLDGGGTARCSHEGLTGKEGWGDSGVLAGSQLGHHADLQHRDDSNSTSRFTQLPRITPQYSPISGHESYLRSFSTVTRLSPISSNGVVQPTGDTNDSRTAVTSAKRMTLKSAVTYDNCSLTSSTWYPNGWEGMSGNHDNLLEEGSEDDDVFTDCSEDRRSDNGSDHLDDESIIDEELSPNLDRGLNGENEEPQQNPQLNTQDVLMQNMRNDTSPVNNNNPTQVGEMATSAYDIETMDNNTEQSPGGSPIASSLAMKPEVDTGDTSENIASESTNGGPETLQDSQSLIPSNGLITSGVDDNGDNDDKLIENSDDSEMNGEKKKSEHENDNKEPQEESEVIYSSTTGAEVSSNETPSALNEPGRRARSYKRRSYNLRDMTASFRTEMSKHCRSIIDREEKQWFDDIVRNSRVVDDTSYDSYARKPLPRIKQTKLVARIYNEKPFIDSVPTPPPPPPLVALKPVQVFSQQSNSNKKVSSAKLKSKHSKLTLSMGR